MKALIEAVSVAVHAVSLASIALDDTLVVVGAGMIGSLALQAGLLTGAGRVFVIDLNDARLKLARSLGATDTFNANNCDPVSEIRAGIIAPPAKPGISSPSAFDVCFHFRVILGLPAKTNETHSCVLPLL